MTREVKPLRKVPKIKPLEAPAIAPARNWGRLSSCPVPWEAEPWPREDQAGTSEHQSLPAEHFVWCVGYHFPPAVLHAAFAPSSADHDLSEVNGEIEGGGAVKVAEETAAVAATPAPRSSASASVPATASDSAHASRASRASVRASHASARASHASVPVSPASPSWGTHRMGDTWLVERAPVGACPPEANSAGHILSCRRMDQDGGMGIEVCYGMNGGYVAYQKQAEQRQQLSVGADVDGGGDASPGGTQEVKSEGDKEKHGNESKKGLGFRKKVRKMMGKMKGKPSTVEQETV